MSDRITTPPPFTTAEADRWARETVGFAIDWRLVDALRRALDERGSKP